MIYLEGVTCTTVLPEEERRGGGCGDVSHVPVEFLVVFFPIVELQRQTVRNV